MLRVGAKYQHLTCGVGCCFHTAQKLAAIFSRRRSFAATGVAAAIAPPTALSKNPTDAQTSVNPGRLTPRSRGSIGAARLCPKPTTSR
jgi:hypothetical protein